MANTTPREPGTLKEGIAKLLPKCMNEICDLTGKCKSTIYAWSNESLPDMPSIRDALIMDKIGLRVLGYSPIFERYRDRIDGIADEETSKSVSDKSILDLVNDASISGSKFSARLLDMVRTEHAELDDFTRSELSEIHSLILAQKNALNALRCKLLESHDEAE